MATRTRILAGAFVVALAGACGGGFSAGRSSTGIEVSGAWVRASIPGTDTTSAYLELRNTGAAADELVGVSVPTEVAERAEIHETVVAAVGGPGTARGRDHTPEPSHDDHTPPTTHHDPPPTTHHVRTPATTHHVESPPSTHHVRTPATTHHVESPPPTRAHRPPFPTTGGRAPAARMHHVRAVAVPRHGTLHLRPGGLHVMILGLRKPLRPGQAVELTLRFRHAGTRTVRAEVRAG